MKAQYDLTGGKRGAVLEAPAGKARSTIRIDDDLLQWLRTQVHAAGGGSYQTLINTALRGITSARSASHWKRRFVESCVKSCREM